MKKNTWRIALAVVLILTVLFIPIPKSVSRDGGTREYAALAYKAVDWNRQTTDGVHETTSVYWFPNNFKSIDELWEYEVQSMAHKFVATVIELDTVCALVQPVQGEDELRSSDRIVIAIKDLGDIGAKVGSTVEITYTGGIMESYPAQIHAVKWEIAKDLRHKEYTEPQVFSICHKEKLISLKILKNPI